MRSLTNAWRSAAHRLSAAWPQGGKRDGLSTEVVLGPDEGLPRTSAARCDCLALMFKRKLTTFVGALPARKIAELNRALAVALELS